MNGRLHHVRISLSLSLSLSSIPPPHLPPPSLSPSPIPSPTHELTRRDFCTSMMGRGSIERSRTLSLLFVLDFPSRLHFSFVFLSACLAWPATDPVGPPALRGLAYAVHARLSTINAKRQPAREAVDPRMSTLGFRCDPRIPLLLYSASGVAQRHKTATEDHHHHHT